MGRPKGSVVYKPEEYADEIVEWIADGKPLREYCRQSGKPSKDVIYEWEKVDPEFARRIARAREFGEDEIALDALAIADHTADDTITDEKGNARPNSEWVARSRLRVETRLKLLAKWNPRKWGDRTEVEHKGTLTLEQIIGAANKVAQDSER